MKTINLTVSGMTCGSCVKHVEKAIHLIAGVNNVEVDLASGAVKVGGDVSQKVNEIIAALKEGGYPARLSSGQANQEKATPSKSLAGCCCG